MATPPQLREVATLVADEYEAARRAESGIDLRTESVRFADDAMTACAPIVMLNQVREVDRATLDNLLRERAADFRARVQRCRTDDTVELRSLIREVVYLYACAELGRREAARLHAEFGGY